MFLNKNVNKYLILTTILLLAFAVQAFPAFAADTMEKPTQQKVFKTADEAADAIITAAKNNDSKMMLDLLGHNYKEIADPTDSALAKISREKFYKLASEKKQLEAVTDGSYILVVGNIEYPFPIPIIKDKNGYRFDTPAGVDEITNRRIGENELVTIAVCREYAKAQREYAEKDRDGDRVKEYARKFVSDEGKKNGLYWDMTKDPESEMSPFGPLVAKAEEYLEAKKDEKGTPFFGYYYKILTKQGENAAGGKYDYVINGNMIGGYALVAYPAKYDVSGIMTFVINQQGVVYQKDLGKGTSDVVKKMDEYNPDKTWTVVTD